MNVIRQLMEDPRRCSNCCGSILVPINIQEFKLPHERVDGYYAAKDVDGNFYYDAKARFPGSPKPEWATHIHRS